ncbi:LacI family transcriptional regulator [Lentzea aerocolonigenes]|uniref:LacI family transcriptional regulator n=1 Tax=Lentzea aerocolonigenes TaxID=68170 RepID=A0A0F0GSK8_LENAE|nr:LacI family DNA-binding transcriptional regulator [Lentzea aerocolonigenes]KJK46290.1 LacI family transcriptional regulator [Lentzea aerocolonigenes]
MVTIVDVAKHARVAPSTVSYVLTGKRSVSAETRARVRDSIQSLGYHHPRAGVRAPANSRTNVLALVLPLREGVRVPAVMRFVTAVVSAARQQGMDVLLVTADQGADGLRRVAGGAVADGFLMMGVGQDDERVSVVRELGRPAVFIGHPAAGGLTCVDLDFEAAGARCVEHLVGLGHRSIGFLGAPSAAYARNTGFARRALAGFGAAAMRRGVVSAALPAEHRYDSVRAAVRTLLRELPRMSALVVHNEAALGWVVECLHAAGRRVPDDLALVAICQDELAERMRLTCVRVPAEVLGRRAVELLMDELNGQQPPPLTLLPPELSSRTGSAASSGISGRFVE